MPRAIASRSRWASGYAGSSAKARSSATDASAPSPAEYAAHAASVAGADTYRVRPGA